MIGQAFSLRQVWDLFQDPVTTEKRRILADRWEELAPEVRRPGQGLGQKATGCGATVGIQPRCDFSCTGCYLGAEANRIPALPTSAPGSDPRATSRSPTARSPSVPPRSWSRSSAMPAPSGSSPWS